MTPREREVLVLLASGLNIKEAARRMGTTPHSERNRLVKIREDLGASTTTHAVVKAVQLGLLESVA